MLVAVAIIAVLFASLGIPAGIALAGLGLIVLMPALIATPGHRLEAASWASSLQPAIIVFYLYATWITAWCMLGHRPRPNFDDPKSISSTVDVLYIMFEFSIIFGWIICAFTGLLLSTACLVRRRNIRPLITLGLAWVAWYLALAWDPLYALYWYFD